MADILNDGEYESGIQSGTHGDDFQKGVALILFLRMREKNSNLRLGYEVKAAEKFDDIVLIDDKNKAIHFVQVKHGSVTDGKAKPIYAEALFPTQKENIKSRGNFELKKYLESYLKVTHHFKELTYEKKFYIFSNRDLNITDEKWVISEEHNDVIEMLQFPGFKGRHLKLIPTREAIVNLKNLSSCVNDDVVKNFFRDFILLVDQPNDLRSIIDMELKKWLRMWVKPDILGKLSKREMSLIYTDLKNTFEKRNKPTAENNKMKHLVGNKDIEECLKKLKNVNKNLEKEETNEFYEFYINRRIIFKQKAEQLADESITEEDTINGNSSIQPTNAMDMTTKNNHSSRNIGNSLSDDRTDSWFNMARDVDLKLTVDCQIKDTEFVEELRGRFKDQQYVVLVADPGMGKTLLLQFLAFEIQQKYEFAIFLVYFGELIKDLDKVEEISDLNGAIRILVSALSKENCEIIKNTSEQRDEKGYSIVLVMDGFDEIHSKYTTKIIAMIKQLGKKQSIQIVISSRMHVQKLLEKTFNVESMLLVPFSEEDQINYLRKMWNVQDTAEPSYKNYSKQLLEKLHSSIPFNMCEIFGLPLIMRMLAEICSEEFEKFLDAIMTNKMQQIDLPLDNLNIVQLYEKFIHKCFHLKLNQKYHSDFTPELKLVIQGYILEHQLLAMKLLDIKILKNLPSKYLEMCDQFVDRCITKSEKSVLVKVVNNSVQFCHLAYSEYFVATYICDNLSSLKPEHIFSVMYEHDVIRQLSMIKLEQENRDLDILKKLCKKNWKVALCACESGCLNIISSLENYFKSFHTSDLSLMLQVSAKAGNVQICELLLKNNADPNEECEEQFNALHFAAQHGHEQVIKLLLKNGANINSRTEFGRTAFHYAALNGHKYALQVLIDNNNDVNVVDNAEWTALHMAAHEGYDQVIQLLLNKNANTNIRTNTGLTPLHVAALKNHKDALKLFIDYHNDVNAADNKQWTALHWASYHDHVTIAELLLCNGANVDAQAKRKLTALHLAARRGHDQVIKLLLINEANPNARTNLGNTPLHIAAAKGYQGASELLINQSDVNMVDNKQCTALHKAALQGHVAVVQLLLTNHAYIDALEESKWTALHLAVYFGHDQVIKVLIKEGANTSLRTNTGKTLLHMAAVRGDKETSNLFLVENHINAVDDNQWTALHWAAVMGHDNVVALLLQNKAMVDAQNKSKWTALHFAAQYGHDQVIKLLINNGANINSRNIYGQTPLHVAARRGFQDIAELLIAKDADVNAVDENLWTALHWAARKGHELVIKLLIKYKKLNTNSKTVDGETALQIAKRIKHKSIVKLLENCTAGED